MIQEYKTNNMQFQIEMILELVRSTFEGNLPKLDWMDEETKKRAIDKAQAVSQKIGYPEYITKPAKLDEHYEKVSWCNFLL